MIGKLSSDLAKMKRLLIAYRLFAIVHDNFADYVGEPIQSAVLPILETDMVLLQGAANIRIWLGQNCTSNYITFRLREDITFPSVRQSADQIFPAGEYQSFQLLDCGLCHSVDPDIQVLIFQGPALVADHPHQIR